MNPGFLTTMLNKFASVATAGYANLMPDALYLMRFFIAIEIVLFGVWYALGKDDGMLGSALRKLTFIFFFIWVLNNIQYLSHTLVLSFGQAGLHAGGNVIPADAIFDPSQIIDFGLVAVRPVFANSSLLSRILSPLDTMGMGWMALFILMAYLFIAINLFVTILEFYIYTVCGTLLVPFILFKPLRYLGERYISGAFAMGIRVMVLAFIIGLSYQTLQSLTLPADPTLRDLALMLGASGAIAFLSWHAPSLAMSLISGAPNLTGGHLFGGATAAYMLGRSAGSLPHRNRRPDKGLEEYKKACVAGNNPIPTRPTIPEA